MATNVLTKVPLLYPELSFTLVGILFSAQNELGPYSREKQYNDLVEEKLKEAKIKYKRELRIGDSGNILNFLIDDKIILETKSVTSITKEHFRQIQNYLESTGIKLGILVNFRSRYLKPIRVLKSSNISSHS